MTRGSTTQTRTFIYDPVTLPESGTKTFVYNNDGTLLRQTDGKNQKMEYAYDTLGRLTMVNRFGPGSMVGVNPGVHKALLVVQSVQPYANS